MKYAWRAEHFDNVDWAMTNEDISRTFSYCTEAIIRKWRRKLGKPQLKNFNSVDFSDVDWDDPNLDLESVRYWKYCTIGAVIRQINLRDKEKARAKARMEKSLVTKPKSKAQLEAENEVLRKALIEINELAWNEDNGNFRKIARMTDALLKPLTHKTTP